MLSTLLEQQTSKGSKGATVPPEEEDDITLIVVTLVVVVAGIVYYLFFNKPKQQRTFSTFKPVTQSRRDTTEDDAHMADRQTLHILYGSQTGTAEEYAQRLGAKAKHYKFRPRVMDIEDFDFEDLENAEAVVLCLATYGEGEPTDSTIDFYEQLNDEFHADDMLSKVKFTVFGLGNKTYKHYNSMGKWADKRFAELGATRIYDMGLGDDDACLEDDFIEWERELFPTLCKEFNIDTSDIGNPEDMPYEFVYSIQFLEPTDPKIPKRNRFVYGNKRTYTATISENQELHTSKSDRSCLHIDFDIAESCVSYEAGDHMAIYPANDKDLVDAMLKRVGASADQYFKLTAKPYVISPPPLSHALSLYLRIIERSPLNTSTPHFTYLTAPPTHHDSRFSTLAVTLTRNITIPAPSPWVPLCRCMRI
eukprot:TRINITY_DN542_c0_g1_i2.p1 TRINITY_DN542_c0_g1~~TRINITY_DN542_c0_g1_i2.p1  ORF type:complete len:421 (-),score=104.17 TRINITY_DN542_c0_g1_i2:1055-2317(-)